MRVPTLTGVPGPRDGAPISSTQAVEEKLLFHEPRLMLLAARDPLMLGSMEATTTAVEAMLARRTTDPCYDELAETLLYLRRVQGQNGNAPTPRVLTKPRLARPAGRMNDNPSAV
ncbi:MAG: hypothetical protein U0Q19_02925 [Kineosporiaceae bacterium]